MATLTPVAKGAALTFAAASGGGDTIALGLGAGKHCRLYVTNGDASSHTVTIADVGACNRGYVHAATGARTVTCVNGKTTPIDIDAYEIDPATGHVGLTYSAVTSVTVATTFI